MVSLSNALINEVLSFFKCETQLLSEFRELGQITVGPSPSVTEQHVSIANTQLKEVIWQIHRVRVVDLRTKPE
jgi:hypothetical protein